MLFDNLFNILDLGKQDVGDLRFAVFHFSLFSDDLFFELFELFVKGIELCKEPWISEIIDFLPELLALDSVVRESLIHIADILLNLCCLFFNVLQAVLEIFFHFFVCFKICGIKMKHFFKLNDVSFKMRLELSQLCNLFFILLPFFFKPSNQKFGVLNSFFIAFNIFGQLLFFKPEAPCFAVPEASLHGSGEFCKVAVQRNHFYFSNAYSSCNFNGVYNQRFTKDILERLFVPRIKFDKLNRQPLHALGFQCLCNVGICSGALHLIEGQKGHHTQFALFEIIDAV